MNKRITKTANDIAKMCPDLVNSGCGDLSCVACLANGLEQIGYRKASDVAAEILKVFWGSATPKKFPTKSQDFEYGYNLAMLEIRNRIYEFEKKYEGEGK